MSSHISVNARILHISSTKRTPASMKNDVRPTTSWNSSAGIWPDSRTASSTAIALASPYASSCTGDAPEWSEEHTSELQSQFHLVCDLLPEKNNARLFEPATL